MSVDVQDAATELLIAQLLEEELRDLEQVKEPLYATVMPIEHVVQITQAMITLPVFAKRSVRRSLALVEQ